jgi:hypothetical protein
MGNNPLQELLRQYTYGEISKPEYRQRRSAIINEITGDEADTQSVSVSERTQPSETTPKLRKSDPQLKYVLIAVLLLAAILFVYISSSVNETKTTSGLNSKFTVTQQSNQPPCCSELTARLPG